MKATAGEKNFLKNMAIKIFSTSHLSSLPSQAVSLIRLNIFKRLDRNSFGYWTTMDEDIEPSGSILKIPVMAKSRLFRFFNRLFWLWKIKPDIILFSGEPWDILFYFLRPRKSKFILHLNGAVPYPLRDYPFRNFRFNLLWYAVVFFVRRAGFILSISEYAANSLKIFKPKAKIEVIYNGVDLDQFDPGKRNKLFLKKKFNLDDSKKIISFIGAMIPLKRPQIFAALAGFFPEIQFVMVGRGGLESDFSQKISLIKNIFRIKEMSRDEVAVLFASSDVFIFPSLFEGFGMVVAEAMASGCPVIVSSGSGPEELVSNDCGIIIPRQESPQKEIESFKSAIKSVIENPERREKMSRNARQKAEKYFDWDELALEWKRVLEENVKGGS